MDKIPTRENFGLLDELFKREAKSGRKNEEGREERNEAEEDYNGKRVIKRCPSAYLEGSDHGNPFPSLSSISQNAKKPYKISTSFPIPSEADPSENCFSLSHPQFNPSIVTAYQSIKNQSKLKNVQDLNHLKQQFALQEKDSTIISSPFILTYIFQEALGKRTWTDSTKD